ncbi:uncharacterized protein [Spinacia oleracea]|uniref:Uncharacterized protein n=1 Tax=Spinacia oleracea TaxID=3562 RepID=A0ABM3RDB7_SPIOL|nr:uncharacterized protein LOC130468070 [Spinacia oleracea]
MPGRIFLVQNLFLLLTKHSIWCCKQKNKRRLQEIQGNVEMSAFQASRQFQGGKQNFGNFQKKDFREMKRIKQELKCDHCDMKGHTKDGCFKLIGYPDWFKGPKGKTVNKLAANVGRIEQGAQQDTPFDHDGEGGRTGNVKPDTNLISAVVQEVMKAFQDKQGGASTSGKTNGMSNFAGPY